MTTASAPSHHGLFAYTAWDTIPVLMALGHAAFVAWLFFGFHHIPWLVWIPCAFVYSISISWSINGSSHAFIHNPFFNSGWLNRFFSILFSLTDGFSQEWYRAVHLQHHMGNMDRIGANGTTVDPISIYRHGKDGQPENVWSYTFASFFRDDIGQSYHWLKDKHPKRARWVRIEMTLMLGGYLLCLIYDWRAFLCMVPFYYLGQSLSSLNGYYEHLKGNPDVPMAWGVSTYNKLYNWLWVYNGYHAEHHYRPRLHWTKLVEFQKSIAAEERAKGVHVMHWCHALGFMDRQPPARTLVAAAAHAAPPTHAA